MWNKVVLESIQPQDLYEDGRPAIWPDQPTEPCDYVVIGEAPGKTEVKESRVFVGRAGQLLREAVADASLGNVHYTNTSLFRPTKGSKDAPPTASIWKKERPRLLLEISMLQPKAVICVGATAAQVLLGNVPRMRGMVKEVTIHGRTYPVYITRHPAAVLHKPRAGVGGPDFYLDVVEDLQRAGRLEKPESYTIGPNPGDGRAVVRFEGTSIAVDTESDGTYLPSASILAVCVTDEQGTHAYTPDTLTELTRALASFRGRIIGHNSGFDEQLLRKSGVPIVFTDDTLLLHYSQDERKGTHGLKTLGPTIARADTAIDIVWPYTHGGDDEDSERVGWKDIPSGDLIRYCGRDAEVTRRLLLALESRADDRTNELYRFLLRASRAFVEGTYQGVLVDSRALETELPAQESRVQTLLAGFDFNPESQPQTLAAFKAAGYHVNSVAADVLHDLEGDLPRRLEHFREQNKLLKAFLRPLQEWTSVDGRAHATVKVHGTDSGRTSCENPNLQQVPDELKHLFIASPGHVLVGWDFSAHEVRGIALLSKDERLCEVLAKGLDPHQYVADQVGVDRQTAKHSLFGVAYGAGAGKLVKTHGIDPRTAERLIETVRKLFPGLDKWRKAVVEQMYEQGYVETPYYHRRRHFYYIDDHTSPHQERVAVNFLPQSLCGDVALDSAISVFEELHYAPLLFVHDFNAIEVPEAKANKVVEQCREIASSLCPNEWVKFVPDMYVAPNWRDMKKNKILRA